jgi:AmmeMemoRadiSam system protein B
MTIVRRPAVAGSFYPADATSLRAAVNRYLEQAKATPGAARPKAIIAPHAGYVYSGPIAASAYSSLAPFASEVERVVLLGPCHRVPLRGLAATEADAFATPLGTVPVDREAVARALSLPQVQLLENAHAMEHSLEVQLPFLQQLLPRFSLAPFAVGDASPQEVAEVLDVLWGGPETLIVISSDLSHYYDYDTARRLDEATSRAIEALDADGLDRESACGRTPVRGLLVAARQHGLEARVLDLRNSGDTAGSRDQVVGYGAYVLA